MSRWLKSLKNSWNKYFLFILFYSSSSLSAPQPVVPSKPVSEVKSALMSLEQGLGLTEALRKLKSNGPSMEKELIAIVNQPQLDLKQRWFGVMALTKLQGKAALKQLTIWTQHKEWFVRLASLKSMSYLPLMASEQPLNIVSERLKDRSILVRDGALEVVSRWCPPQMKSQVLGMLDDKTHFRKNHPLFIRKSAVKVLGQCQFGGSQVHARLIQVFDEKDFYGMHEATHQTLSVITGKHPKFTSDAKKMKLQWKNEIAKLAKN